MNIIDEQLMDIIYTAYTLAQVARVRGLLVLRDYIEDIEPPYFKEGVTMLAEGADPDELNALMKEVMEEAPTLEDRELARAVKSALGWLFSGTEPDLISWQLLMGGTTLNKTEVFEALREKLYDFHMRKHEYLKEAKLLDIPADLREEADEIFLDEFLHNFGVSIVSVDLPTLGKVLAGCSADIQASILNKLPLVDVEFLIDRASRSGIDAGEAERAMNFFIEKQGR